MYSHENHMRIKLGHQAVTQFNDIFGETDWTIDKIPFRVGM